MTSSLGRGRLLAVIPAYNEQGAIRRVAAGVREVCLLYTSRPRSNGATRKFASTIWPLARSALTTARLTRI